MSWTTSLSRRGIYVALSSGNAVNLVTTMVVVHDVVAVPVTTGVAIAVGRITTGTTSTSTGIIMKPQGNFSFPFWNGNGTIRKSDRVVVVVGQSLEILLRFHFVVNTVFFVSLLCNIFSICSMAFLLKRKHWYGRIFYTVCTFFQNAGTSEKSARRRQSNGRWEGGALGSCTADIVQIVPVEVLPVAW